MKWNKLGRIYIPENDDPYLLTHSSNPLALFLQDDVFRIFYNGRNADNRSSVSYADIDILKKEIVYDHKKPVFKYGDDDTFYSHGVSIGGSYKAEENEYILFMGWQCPEGQHWRGDIGRLLLKNKISELALDPSIPFITTDEEDPVSLSYPYVIFENGIYKMWYGTTIDWSSENGEMIHVIKYAESKDGVNWNKKGLAIPYEIGKAQAFSRPALLVKDGAYHMWYSYRSGDGSKYKIGYSVSNDGIKWEPDNLNSGINASEEGWDSEMVCYPFVFTHKENIYMLYNGNSHGKSGFGLAILED
ncbi:MAG: hypothetical protein R2942_18675 [Ignavibacteria bacterium]|nr:hypothetical protein [Ignavibacteriota bacterium]